MYMYIYIQNMYLYIQNTAVSGVWSKFPVGRRNLAHRFMSKRLHFASVSVLFETTLISDRTHYRCKCLVCTTHCIAVYFVKYSILYTALVNSRHELHCRSFDLREEI